MPWEIAASVDRLAAGIVLPQPPDRVYHYLVPDDLRPKIATGQRVRVPFGRGNRLLTGYCVEIGSPPETGRRLKSIESILDGEPLLSQTMLDLTRWMADRYLCRWGQVLETVVPAGVKNKAGTRLVTFLELSGDPLAGIDELSLPPKQRAVLRVLTDTAIPMRIEELTHAADCGTGPINALRKKGLIQAIRRRAERDAGDIGPVERENDLIPNRDQAGALASILAVLRSGTHRTLLLHGVTGSGKTEVYIQAIREVVAYGRQAIVLVPEISLTPQTIRRFRSRFDSVAVLHSHLSDAERRRHWEQIARGEVQVVVGARSAVFAPTPHLGLIVIDEEHETSFKQDSTPRYHAREVARRRTELEKIPLVLGSATPTLESWQRVLEKKDVLLSLPRRVEKLPMPPVVIVDIRNDPHCTRGQSIGRALQTAMQHALRNGGQVILFLNLRGYSPAIWCRACGESAKCPRCDITLTWHRDRRKALCHSCDFETTPPTSCPHCGAGGLRYVGSGTQRLEEEVRAKFPGVPALRMDSDSMRRRGSHDVALNAFRHGDVRILLGTQMIAKGLDFPNVTLVGVIAADTVLHQPDLRAAERTFQLISQVAGRTGRSARGGRVFVQTCSPAEPAIVKAAEHDYRGFVAGELPHRREMNAPPFRVLTRIVARGKNETSVRDFIGQLTDRIREAAESHGKAVTVLGPAPAPVTKLKNDYRYHLQLSAERFEEIQAVWRDVENGIPTHKDVQFVIDVDPMNMR